MDRKLIIKILLILIIALAICDVVLVFESTAKTLSISPNQLSFAPTPKAVSLPDLTLNRIFDNNRSDLQIPENEKITMIATGDIIPARSTNMKVVTYNDPLWPYRKTVDVLKNADLTVINLETPLLKACNATIEGMIFCGTDKNVEGLKFAGVDVATIANNHIGNYGAEGVAVTAKLLSDNGILPTSSSGAVFKTIKGTTFAFLAYNDIGAPEAGVSWADEEKIKGQIAEARSHADIVIVSYHWGVEYVTLPSDRQKELGHLTIDAGADLVIGNHPHWIEPIEFYKGKLITYAHGNFVFDQMWSQKTREGVVGKYTFFNKKLIDVEYLPVLISDYGQPEFMQGNDKNRIISEMRMQSEILRNISQ